MKRSVLAVLVLVLAASLVLVGCGKSPGGGSGGGNGSSSGGSSGSSGGSTSLEKPYPTITPESANEKAAVAGAQSALDGYIRGADDANKQNNRTDPVFRNEAGYKPRFVGYAFSVYSPKAADGTFRSLEVGCFDNAKQVKPYSVWERQGTLNRGDGVMNDSYFDGVSSTFDPSSYLMNLPPESAGEKAAMAAVKSWAKKNLAPTMTNVILTGYFIQWGEAEQRPNMMMMVNPDGNSFGSVISWEAQ